MLARCRTGPWCRRSNTLNTADRELVAGRCRNLREERSEESEYEEEEVKEDEEAEEERKLWRVPVKRPVDSSGDGPLSRVDACDGPVNVEPSDDPNSTEGGRR
jgi:hypothetical protein